MAISSSGVGVGEGEEGRGVHSAHYGEQRTRIVMIFFFRRNLENYLSKI